MDHNTINIINIVLNVVLWGNILRKEYRRLYALKYTKKDYKLLKDMMEMAAQQYQDSLKLSHHVIFEDCVYHTYLNAEDYSFTFQNKSMGHLARWLGVIDFKKEGNKFLWKLLFKEKLENVPLFINHKDAIVRVIADWRLKIGK
jgi:hypothetical protein